ncbi:hypothetical protein BT93_B1118 [Corymbia citriodora subsp. variegata]|nr:hypothetical protein BT93_B1118 [Corymbia citriodora subsp. variegata]
MANWEELPQELLKLIAQRLAIEDFVAFGAACSSWLSAAAKETYDAKSKPPWLVTYVYKQTPGAPWLTADVSNHITEFCSPSRGRTYPLKSLGTQAKTLSPPGWMLVSNWSSEYLRIFNPLSRISIELPTLEKLFSESFFSLDPVIQRMVRPRIKRMALSSSPSSSGSYAVMIALDWDIGLPWLAFYRSGDDAWREVSPATHPPWTEVLQLIYYDGLFVALDAENHITTLNESESRMESRLVLEQKFEGRPYLVECSGSLLVAWETTGAKGNRFRVFDVDLEKGTKEEVKSLGKASLFLNDNSSFSMDFDAASCLAGFKPNHIYFTDYTNEEEEKKIYSMDCGKVETYSDVIGHSHAGQWFRPNF